MRLTTLKLIAFFSQRGPHRPAGRIFGHFLHEIVFIGYYKIINVMFINNIRPFDGWPATSMATRFHADVLYILFM